MPKAVTLSEPTPVHERIQAIDILRGFALLGILTVNFTGSEVARLGRVDDEIRRLLDFFVSEKFYTTFSFLFGLGFALQLFRARKKNTRIVPVYIRRMAVLFLIGAFHAVFIWSGDVLKYYAVMGLILILFRNRSAKILIFFAILSLGYEFWSYMPDAPPDRIAALLPVRHDPETQQRRELERVLVYAQTQEAWQRLSIANKSGTYFQAVGARFEAQKVRIGFLSTYFWASSFAMFLLGLYAGKRGVFHDLARSRKFLKGVMWTAFPVALLTNLINTYGFRIMGNLYQQFPDWLWNILYVLAGPAGSIFYISGLLLLLTRSGRWMRRLGFLRWVGRMPLTNYLMQSVVGTLVYNGYGLGMYSKLGYSVGLLLTLAVFALQIPLSRWWLRRFQFGPVEWLWRSLTYGRPQPMLIRVSTTAETSSS
jgi:uncharacterized protein